ncbi:RHS repeat-associated core domain-containing protein [Streptomyces violaceusniger]|uniref:RHS repeat-associated core domain-containing protein n=1 Tax=Streptomyces violaceusniger TaxID=68280 RepID=UPI0037FAC85D
MGTSSRHREPPRFPGQYADPETGLNYNHFRYYDPETARYVASFVPERRGLVWYDHLIVEGDHLALSVRHGDGAFGLTWIRLVRAGWGRPSARHAPPAKRNPRGTARCGGRPR